MEPAVTTTNDTPGTPTSPATAVTTQEKGLRAWVLKALNSKHATAAMATVAVVDGSVFPVPPFALLGPMVLAQPKKAPLYAAIGTVASLIGGAIGYALGFYLSEWVKQTLGIDLNLRVQRFGVDVTIAEALSTHFWLLALAASVLPTPFKVVAIGCGMLHVDIASFAAASLLGRTARMFGFCLTLAYAREWGMKFFKVKPRG